MRIALLIILFCWQQGAAQTTSPNSQSQQSPPNAQAPAQRTVYRVPSDYAFFSADRTVMPNYPDEALKKSIDGRVILAVEYSTEGNVEAVGRIEGQPALLPSAIQAATQWKFRPLKVKGKKVKGVTYVGFHFHATAPPKITNVFPYGVWSVVPYAEGKESKDEAKPAPVDTRVRLSSGVVAGQKISGPNPIYPEGARRNRVQGSVDMQAVIDKSGTIKLLEIVSSPALDLSAAAIQAVRDWKYRPYTLQGQPVEVESTIQVNFTLRG